jgi:hypothetical protein
VKKVTPSFDIDDSVLYDEFVYIEQAIDPENLAEWPSTRTSTDGLCMEIVTLQHQ